MTSARMMAGCAPRVVSGRIMTVTVMPAFWSVSRPLLMQRRKRRASVCAGQPGAQRGQHNLNVNQVIADVWRQVFAPRKGLGLFGQLFGSEQRFALFGVKLDRVIRCDVHFVTCQMLGHAPAAVCAYRLQS